MLRAATLGKQAGRKCQSTRRVVCRGWAGRGQGQRAVRAASLDKQGEASEHVTRKNAKSCSSVCVVAAGRDRGHGALRAASLGKEGETSEQVKERRLRESQRVEERVHVIFSYDEFQEQLREVGLAPLPHGSKDWPSARRNAVAVGPLSGNGFKEVWGSAWLSLSVALLLWLCLRLLHPQHHCLGCEGSQPVQT